MFGRCLPYKTYARSKLEPMAAVWSLNRACFIKHMESIQNQAARFVAISFSSCRTSVTTLKDSFGVSSLVICRKVLRLCLLHMFLYSTTALGAFLTPLTEPALLNNNNCIKTLWENPLFQQLFFSKQHCILEQPA